MPEVNQQPPAPKSSRGRQTSFPSRIHLPYCMPHRVLRQMALSLPAIEGARIHDAARGGFRAMRACRQARYGYGIGHFLGGILTPW
jgi:hypothetical protein